MPDRGAVNLVPHTEVPEPQTLVRTDDRSPAEGADGLLTRRPDGNIPSFDEIVTPHPVVAFLFRRRTFIVLLAILAMLPWADPKPGPIGLWVGNGSRGDFAELKVTPAAH